MIKPSNNKPIIEAKHVFKSYEGVKALVDVKMELRRGEVHALVGENGAGKSTLVKILMGVIPSDAGQIIFDGQPVEINNPQDARELGISAIFQEASLFPDLSVAENIFIGHEPMTKIGIIDWQKMNKIAVQPLKELGVKIDVRRKVIGISIAQMQMVEIAKALSFDAQILIMDEPTSALTLHEVEDLFRIVRKLKESNKTVLFISHRLDEIFQIADRVTVFRDGQYVDTREVKGLTHEELVHMMVGRNIAEMFSKLQVKQGGVTLEVKNLTREGIFEDISFKLHRGEILGLAGLVGARRTDVANTLFGVTPADSGDFYIDGNKIEIDSPQKAMALGFAYVPENRQLHGLVLASNIIKNISLPILRKFSRFYFINRKKETTRAKAMHKKLDVRSSGLHQLAQELSGGNQQKLVLAKWLGTQPQILILDEPTRGIDVGTKAAVHKLMSELARDGMAILMISSELPEVLGMSDRVLVMCEGKMTGEFKRKEATQEKIMAVATARNLLGNNRQVKTKVKA
ncbi:MAG TPA: sugar ABC transporter ATP-binding protein [Anaerolineae bacterium]|nr:sugar ABC transporter ATP-binding protein [Anaerolineae bacterium]